MDSYTLKEIVKKLGNIDGRIIRNIQTYTNYSINGYDSIELVEETFSNLNKDDSEELYRFRYEGKYEDFRGYAEAKKYMKNYLGVNEISLEETFKEVNIIIIVYNIVEVNVKITDENEIFIKKNMRGQFEKVSNIDELVNCLYEIN